VWGAVAREWGLPSQLKALDEKLEALDHVYEHLTAAVSDRRARRLNGFVLVFTFASVITFGFAVADFFGKPLPEPRLLNVLIVAVLVALAAVLWLALRRLLRVPSAPRRFRGAKRT
jgi:hypothetical protein